MQIEDATLAAHPKIGVPENLRRGHFRDDPELAINSAVSLLDEIRRILNRPSLADVRFLDIGCGDKFSVALINRQIPIGRYHGVDVNRGAIDFLDSAVSLPNFSYKHIDVYNQMYNRQGAALSVDTDIGVPGQTFDAVGLFSVFTHLAPDDYVAMLQLSRRYVAADGKLIYTSFIMTQDEEFIDENPERPLLRATYNEAALRRHLAATGWMLESLAPPKRRQKRLVVCRPI